MHVQKQPENGYDLDEKVFSAILPLKTVSESNMTSEHWSKKHKRHKNQHLSVRLAFRNQSIPTPCHVVLTRFASRFLDDDNLVSSCKWIRDAIAYEIIGRQIALSPGQCDNTSDILWSYNQIKCKRGNENVLVEIYKINPTLCHKYGFLCC